MSFLWGILELFLLGLGSADRLPLDTSDYTFQQFKADFNRSYEEGGVEHQLREDIFNSRMQEIREHNAQGRSWKKGVNHFTDLTEDELKRMRGYKRWNRPAPAVSGSGGSLLEVASGFNDSSCSLHNNACHEKTSSCCEGLVCGAHALCVEAKAIPKAHEWSSKLATAKHVMNQGQCGSCWAVAATGALQMQASITTGNRLTKILSPQNILGCTPNLLSCGGEGGCQGATAELAFDWLQSMGEAGGVHTLDNQAYTATSDDGCPAQHGSFLQAKSHPTVSIKGYRQLKENQADDVLKHLVNVGPLTSSIVGKPLQSYRRGVIDSCDSAVVDHAVLMMGYGKDAASNSFYWNIRNSWGGKWGEQGFFRLRRHAPDGEEPCFDDHEPDKGVACKDKPGPEGKYPTLTRVCGECGILSDTSYPIGTKVPAELLDAQAESAMHHAF